MVRRVDLQLADHSRQLGREGDEAAAGRRGVLGEEQLAAAEDALEATMKPPLPPEPKRVEVSMARPGVSRRPPPSAMIRPPGASVTSRTGIVVPRVRVCMSPKLARQGRAPVEIVGPARSGRARNIALTPISRSRA